MIVKIYTDFKLRLCVLDNKMPGLKKAYKIKDPIMKCSEDIR